jgi:hypothetical protein
LIDKTEIVILIEKDVNEHRLFLWRKKKGRKLHFRPMAIHKILRSRKPLNPYFAAFSAACAAANRAIGTRYGLQLT